ncbi:MAG: MSMEG_1061 family FMN-dependent PPOX-type flavoprotein [Pirellulaceae bacterium]
MDKSHFTDVVSTVEELEAVLGRPNPRVARKVIFTLDAHCRQFIGRSPFVLVASADRNGNVDITPKGDPPGFVRILDDSTLAIPERPGNRRADTFRNVLENPDVGLIFLIPGKRETLRVSGRAAIVRDLELRSAMAIGGRIPELALVVFVGEAFIHCAKCMMRSALWEPAAWPPTADLASLAEVAVAHAALTESVAEVQALIDTDEKTRLY